MGKIAIKKSAAGVQLLCCVGIIVCGLSIIGLVTYALMPASVALDRKPVLRKFKTYTVPSACDCGMAVMSCMCDNKSTRIITTGFADDG